jgi:large subunit ribosomal protein L18
MHKRKIHFKVNEKTVHRPRISVFRSAKRIYAQLVDDLKGKTLVAASDLEIKSKNKMTKTQKAAQVGELLAQKAKTAKINKVQFDRRNYRYHGRVQALAEGARKGGLKF